MGIFEKVEKYTPAAIRLGRDEAIRQVTSGGELFPGMVAEQKGEWVKVSADKV